MQVENISGCYVAINLHNTKAYVGSTLTYRKRKGEHKNNHNHKDEKYRNACPKFYPALRKNGWDAFYWDFFPCDKDKIRALETVLIAEYDSFHNGYNCTDGGEGGRHSEESKKKMSESKKGISFTDEHKKNISKALTGNKYLVGRTASDESNAKRSKTMMGRKFSKDTLEKMRLAASNQSKETKLKISDSLKKYYKGNPKVVSEETRLRISNSLKKDNICPVCKVNERVKHKTRMSAYCRPCNNKKSIEYKQRKVK